MQYELALPRDWKKGVTYPVVIACEASEKEFRKNAERFEAARGTVPFIIVSPYITTNGNYGLHDTVVYPYRKDVWDRIDREGNCLFDDQGLLAVINDVKRLYGGADKVFITGFEAGAHLVWATAFHHPEQLFAAAMVAGNFRKRCEDGNTISGHPSRASLPLLNFVGGDDQDFGKGSRLYGQYEEAKELALTHGYTNLSETVLPGTGHVPVTRDVLEAFAAIWKRERAR
ncbi:MAG: hypothetical protein JWP27_2798 [Flaviaesturariibacter sp.]|nr:hypothetical protein [Flaviaesturariibacter sp.]